ERSRALVAEPLAKRGRHDDRSHTHLQLPGPTSHDDDGIVVVDCQQHSVGSCAIHRIRQPLTGPPWKNAAGVITPSFLNSWPSFMTNCTFFSASTSSSGLPGMAMKSAKSPALIGPRVFSVSLTL